MLNLSIDPYSEFADMAKKVVNDITVKVKKQFFKLKYFKNFNRKLWINIQQSLLENTGFVIKLP